MPDPRAALALATLELRRGLLAPAPLAGLALLALLMSGSWGSAGLARQGLWAGALLVAVPMTIVHAAGVVPRWRRGEGDWLGSRPVAPGVALAACWAGTAAAGLIWLGLAALLIELRVGGSTTLRPIWEHDLAEVQRLEPGEGRRLELDAPPTRAGDRLRVRVRPSVGLGPTSDARLALARDGHGEETTVRVATRAWVEVAAPEGDGALLVQLDDVGEGALAWLTPGSLELWRPAGSAGLGSLSLWWRASCLLAGAAALALGASAWVGQGTATGVGLCLLPAGALVGSPPFVPGIDLVRALAVVGEGRLPAQPSPAAFVGAIALVTVGLSLARPGVASWRHGR